MIGEYRRPGAVAVGVIGLGQIGQVHVAAIRQSPAGYLAAVADTATELRQPFAAEGLPAYADAAELIADPARRNCIGRPGANPRSPGPPGWRRSG